MPISYVILGDTAFSLQPYSLKLFSHDTEINNITFHRVFNHRLSKSRKTAENAFGIAASIGRDLRKPIMLNLNIDYCVIFAIKSLHNYLRTKKNNYIIVHYFWKLRP